MTGGLKIRERERSRFFFFVAVNCLMNVGLTIGQSVSEGLFLSRPGLGPSMLPAVFIVTAVATAASTFVYAAFVDKVRNDRYFQIIHAYAVGGLVLILTGIYFNLTPAFMAFYGFFYVVQGIFNTHFWNYATDYFDAVEAKRLFPFFPLGNSIGGFVGGSLASLLGAAVPPLLLASSWLLLLISTWVLIQVVSPRLKGWVVMEAEETDEASLDNVRQGFKFLRRSAMGRWHIVYAIVMITSLFFLQYLYSSVFAAAYPNAEELTAFIGRFLALTNVVEIILEVTFTPRLIGLAGVGAANMFYPLSTLGGFILIGWMRGVPAAIYSRMNRETFDNAISSSCRNLLYNAYPSRFRGRIRAFIEGAVTNAGIVVAGIVMMVLSRFFEGPALMNVVVYLGIGFSIAFLGVAVIIRQEYLNSLVRGLKDYHLDLDDVSLELDKVSDEDLNEMLPQLEANGDEASVALVTRIFGVLLSRGALDSLVNRIEHANPRVQLAAMEVLGSGVAAGMRRSTATQVMPRETTAIRKESGETAAIRKDSAAMRKAPESAAQRLRASLEKVAASADATPDVRARGVELLAQMEGPDHVRRYLEDAVPQVRAAAAGLIVAATQSHEAWTLIEAMLASDDATERTAALRHLPMHVPRSVELLLAHVEDDNPEVRHALLDQLEAVDPALDGVTAGVQPLLSDRSDDVRAGIVKFLGRSRDERIVPMLAQRLEDDSIHVRRTAIDVLRPWGGQVVPYVRPMLEAKSTTSVDAALAVLGGTEDPAARDIVREWLKTLLASAHEAVVAREVMASAMTAITQRLDEEAAQAVEHAVGTTEPLAAIAIRDFTARVSHHAMKGLESLEDPTVIRNIRRCLETSHRQARGDAMEALSNLREQAIAKGLLALLDDNTPAESLAASLHYLGLEKPRPWEELLRGLSEHPDRWIRVASAILAEETEPGPGVEDSDYRRTEEYAVMKNLLFLKKVPLFSQMTLEQLEIISRIVTELSFFKGEVIFKEKEIGDKLYIIAGGKVAVVKNYRTPAEVTLAVLKETDYFGEMAVLDNEPRSATIHVEEDSKLLSISGEKLRDIIHQKPEIAFEIFKVLSGRLRRADSKLSEMAKENIGLREKAAAVHAAEEALQM